MLKLHDISVTYPDKTKAISNFSFSLGDGENIALIGQNGAGKTSLLLAIMGILELSSGVIEIEGSPLNKKSVDKLRKHVGMVFQNPDDQLFMPRIYDDVAFGCRNYGMPEDEILPHVSNILDQLNIGHLAEKSPLRLSGGEKRLAAIATVLAMNPSILIFDEPTAFLDPKARRRLISTLKEMKHPKIIATHDMAFAADLCNRVLVLDNGRLMADGDISLLSDDAALQGWGL